MMRALRHLAEKQFQPTAILDVGAGKGYWSVLASSYFPQAQFHLLEPLAENEHALAMVAASNLQLHYTLVAAGNESGERTIQVAPEVDSSTMLFFPEADPALQRQVPIATIDELIDQNRIPLPDLVKIDVQCMELEVLKGAQRLFDHTEVFVIEVNLYEFLPNCPRVHEVMRYLEDRGYHLYDLAGSLRRPFEDDLGQLDLVMVSDKSFLTASKRWQ